MPETPDLNVPEIVAGGGTISFWREGDSLAIKFDAPNDNLESFYDGTIYVTNADFSFPNAEEVRGAVDLFVNENSVIYIDGGDFQLALITHLIGFGYIVDSENLQVAMWNISES